VNYEQIKQALDGAVSAIEGLPPTYGPNEVNKAARSPFTRTTLLPSRPNRLSVGVTGVDELIGLYQVDLYYPMGTGSADAIQWADQIVALFPRTWMVNIDGKQLRVTECWLEAGREVNNWYATSVMLSWSAIR
jgi:hypothetical protein